MALVLASQSPRRRELMSLVTTAFEVDSSDLAEDARGLSPAAMALALGSQKAADVAPRRPKDAVIGCDTVVEAHGMALGKPENEADAVQMLGNLSGQWHHVHTGVALFLPGESEPADSFIETTAVQFGPMPPEEIEAYVKTAEPYDKAGGYAIQGWAARYILRIEGCFYNVMGLPIARLHRHLRALGLVR